MIPNLILLEERLLIAERKQGLAVYDFDFELYFNCRHPHQFTQTLPSLLRVGAIDDYPEQYAALQELGLAPVNDPQQHLLASELANWYPLLQDMTPASAVYQTFPDAEEVEARFGWPVFLKGSRQTSRHQVALAVVENRRHYEQVRLDYARDPILHWQAPVLREYVPLQRLPGQVPGQLPPALEFRSFWWQGRCVGCGCYWYRLPPYAAPDLEQGLALAQEAARRLQVPFLVIDFAKSAAGQWLIIECNDAQESGYAGIDARRLWQEILQCFE